MRSAVIIPVYNQERWIGRCLDSLGAQTCRDFVAIAVDDGSTDESASVLSRRAAAADFDLRVVRRENGGVSAARNSGLSAALSMSDVDSVMFLDPDDRYLPTCVARARRAHEEAPDAVIEWTFASPGRDRSEFAAADRLQPNVWCKLYPREIVSDVRFCEETNIAEDLAFNLAVEHRHRPRLVRIPEALYFYEDNALSAMHRPLTARDFACRAAVINHIVSIYGDDSSARDTVCREEVPELLKQFRRSLARVPPSEAEAARLIFRELLVSLRGRGLLHPKRGRLKEFKHYLRFRLDCLFSLSS